MSDTIRWGILGTGSIAHKFAGGLAVLPDAALVAVGSRRQETADGFGDEFDVPNRHAGYEALAADPDVDVVYVASPHNHHHDMTVDALNAGRHVLCEKAFALNAGQAREMIAAGLAARVSCLDPRKMPRELAGAEFGPEFLAKLPANVDPCGENGEFHTCLVGGAGLRDLPYETGEVVHRDSAVYCDLWIKKK